jgi:peptidylprolyl isomerase
MTIENVKVIGEFGVNPTLEFSASSAPEGLQVDVLSAGDGAEVKAGQEIDVNYHGQIWDGELFDSSFKRGSSISFGIGIGQVIKGWDDALVGQKIGSRVLISIPPEFGYGVRGMPQAGIKGTDTLVFVVDILGAE